MKKIYRVIGKPAGADVNQVEVSTRYELGCDGYRPRGYYVSVTPQKAGIVVNGFSMTQISSDTAGFYCRLLEVSRKSARAEAQADGICMEHIGEYLDRIEQKYGIVVDRSSPGEAS